MRWIDITVTLQNGMVGWPGDPPFVLDRFASFKKGDGLNISAVSSCLHIGTHVDAPLHYLENGCDVTALPLDTLTGTVRVIRITTGR